MRRKDREMSKSFALSVIDKCEYANLGMIGPDGFPYCIPITIVRSENIIYFHTAKEGEKINALNANNNVCLSCVGDTLRASDKFTTEFESAIVKGAASEVENNNEKIFALRLLCMRHTPSNMHEFDNAISKSLDRTGIWKIEIKSITGKRKKYDKNGKEMKFGRMK